MKVIRLHTQIRVGNDLIPPNAVVEAEDGIASTLVGDGHAEETDSLERYPNFKRVLTHVDEVDVTGAEEFPLPEDDERKVDLDG